MLSAHSTMRRTLTQPTQNTNERVNDVIKKSIIIAYNHYKNREFKDAATVLDMVFLTNKTDIKDKRILPMLKKMVEDVIRVEERYEYMKDGFLLFFDDMAAIHNKWRDTQKDLVVDDLQSSFHDISSIVPMLESLHNRLNALESKIV